MSIEETKTEVTIRNIYHDGQYAPALCIRTAGDRNVPCIFADVISGIRVTMLSVQTHDKSEPVMFHGAPYPLNRHFTYLAHTARSYPCTPEAHRILSALIPDFPPARTPEEVRATGEAELNETPRPKRRKRPNGATPPETGSDDEPEPEAPKTAPKSGSPTIIGALCAELGLDPAKARAALRKAGLSAPYTDEEKIRSVLGGTKK
jgi:hypothetical protein